MAIPFLKGIDVAGTVDLSNLTIDGAQGADGQVLTSTSTGIAWEDASGGASLSGGEASKVAVWSATDTLTHHDDFHFDTTNVRLGIGDSNPNRPLVVSETRTDSTASDAYTTVVKSVQGSGLSTNPGTGGLKVQYTSSSSNVHAFGLVAGSSSSDFLTTGPMHFYTNSDLDTVSATGFAMQLDTSQRLTLGSMTASQKLNVSGNVLANRYYSAPAAGNYSTQYYLDPNDFVTSAVLGGDVAIGDNSTPAHRLVVRTPGGEPGNTEDGVFIKSPFAGGSAVTTDAQPFLSIGCRNTSGGVSRIFLGQNATATSQESLIEYSRDNDALSIYKKQMGTYTEHVRFGNIGSSGTARTRFYGNVGIGVDPTEKLHVNGDFLVNNTSGAANGSAHEIARLINTTSGATSSYMYIGASSGNDWRVGKNILGTLGGSNFGIAKHSGTTLALEIDGSNNATIAGRVKAEGYTTDGNAKLYTWRALDNTSSSSSQYFKIARITGSQSTRFIIELAGRSTSYSDGSLPAFGKIVGQLNNDNNYDIVYYNASATDEVVDEVGQVDVSTTATDIYVRIGNFAELVATASISDGTITTYAGVSASTSTPTGYVQATEYKLWNTGNDGAGSGLDADKLDAQEGSYYLDYNNFTNTPTIPSAYSHPTHPGDDISIDTGSLTGATVISDLDFNITTDTLGHVTDANAAISTRTLTAANIGAAASSHNHDDRYYTESESDNRFTSIDHFRHTGTGYYTSTTTSALLSEALGDNAFDSKLSAHKTGWSYAGNGNLTDAGRLTELAGTSWLWWTDNSTDNVQGNVTALCIAPNTGGSAGKMFVYNNQGSTYSPGWREIWTSTSDGSGSGLDADLLDGNHASAFASSSHNHAASDITSGTFAAARIAHNSFDIGDTTAETGRSVHETGIYTFNRNNGTLGTGTDSAYYSVLAFGQGAGGSVQIAGQWTSGGNKLYWRSLRDTTDNWWDWKEIYHTTHKPTPSEIGAVATTGDTMTGALTIDTTTHATLSLDRASTSYDNNLIFRTAGTIKWRLWQDGSDDYLYIRNESGSNNVMTWRNNNTVGINTGTPNATLHLQVPTAGAPSIFLQSASNFSPGIYFDDSNTGTSAAGAITYLNANNTFNIKANSSGVVTISSGTTTISATADIVAYSSDKRLKENVQPIEKPLNKVLKLEGVTYNWNKKAEDVAGFDTKIKEVGLFAQDVQKVLPEAVKLAPFDTDEDFKSKSGKDYLTVQYEKIVPLLVEAIKDQQKQIDELKSIINGGS